jgi:death-on-curing protein
VIAYISFELVLEFHDQLIAEYGGAKGILNEGLLRSALEMPKACFDGRDLHQTIYDKTAAYLFHLIQNRPFVDGNKRTASITALAFLASNAKGGFGFCCDDEYQDLIVGVAQGRISKKEIARFFRASQTKRSPKIVSKH